MKKIENVCRFTFYTDELIIETDNCML